MANFGNILSNIAIGAGQSIRRNAGDSAFEAYTPSGGGNVTGPGSSTDNAVVRFDGTGGTTIQNSTATIDDNGRLSIATGTNGGIKLGDANYMTEHTSLDFLDLQRVGTDYTLMRIKAPTGSSNEATLSLLIDVDEDNSGVNEEFIDFYNEKYDDSERAGIRAIKTGTGELKPFVIGHWDSVTAKNDGDGLIVFPYDAVVVQNSLNVGQGVATSTVAYSRFGTATTGHSLAAKDDVLISGLLEVDDAGFFDSTLTVASTVTGATFVPTSSSAPTNGMYLAASNTLGWSVNSAAEWQLTSSAFSPASNDGSAIGTTSLGVADMHFATGAVVNYANGNYTLTHSSGILTASNDFRVTSAGTNTASVSTLGGTQTFTNKRITKRVGTTTSSATPTINTDNVDYYSLTAQAADITSFTTNLSGTPTDNQTLWISITGTGARAITWGSSFEASTVSLPTTTVSTNRLDVGFVWNAATSKWRCVASA